MYRYNLVFARTCSDYLYNLNIRMENIRWSCHRSTTSECNRDMFLDQVLGHTLEDIPSD